MTNSSFTDGFDAFVMESEADGAPKVKDSCTISTQDSLQKKEKKSSKRGGKKSKSKKTTSLEASLSNLSMDDVESPTKQTDAPTVATADSRVQKEKKSRRGAKKKALADLETSLTELLTDEEEPESPTVRESFTVSTLDSLDKNALSGRSRRGAKKSSNLGSVLGKLEGPKDFGRDCDDNDTFCGLGTVGEKELAKSPKSRKSPGVKKTKIVSPRQKKYSGGGGAAVFGNMMMPSNDSDSEEEDLFESFESNPFRVPYH